MTIAFVIPVRHHLNSRDWGRSKAFLTATVRSIAVQSSHDWRCIVVANRDSDLPLLPKSIEVVRVDFPPNKAHEKSTQQSALDFHDAVRFDKGSRVLAGLKAADDVNHYMVVDDDDFIHRDLAAFAAKRKHDNGWVIQNGYLWVDGSIFIYEEPNFPQICGTSHIVNIKFLDHARAERDVAYLQEMLGSHREIGKHLSEQGVRLDVLPFAGAVYRVGHENSHSRSRSNVLLHKDNIKKPSRFIKLAKRMKFIDGVIDQEFFGAAPSSRKLPRSVRASSTERFSKSQSA